MASEERADYVMCCARCAEVVHYQPPKAYTPGGFICGLHGLLRNMDMFERRRPLRLVWLRSNLVSYTSEVRHSTLLPDGSVEGMPGFTWERFEL